MFLLKDLSKYFLEVLDTTKSDEIITELLSDLTIWDG